LVRDDLVSNDSVSSQICSGDRGVFVTDGNQLDALTAQVVVQPFVKRHAIGAKVTRAPDIQHQRRLAIPKRHTRDGLGAVANVDAWSTRLQRLHALVPARGKRTAHENAGDDDRDVDEPLETVLTA